MRFQIIAAVNFAQPTSSRLLSSKVSSDFFSELPLGLVVWSNWEHVLPLRPFHEGSN